MSIANKYMTIAGHNDGLIKDYCWNKAKEHIEASVDNTIPVNRAILFYGGGSPEANYDRYYKNLQDMIESLEGKVKPGNIIVLHADGLHPEADRNLSDGGATPTLVDSDLKFLEEKGIAVLPATSECLQKVFSTVDSVIKPEDHTLVYTFDHGNRTPDGESIIGWNQEQIMDKDFAQMVNHLGGYKTFVFSECYAGGVAEDIDVSDGKTSVMAATAADEVSYGDGFAKSFSLAIRDGNISTEQLFLQSKSLDQHADHTEELSQDYVPVEHPVFHGADFPVFHTSETVSSNAIEEVDPELAGMNTMLFDDELSDVSFADDTSMDDADIDPELQGMVLPDEDEEFEFVSDDDIGMDDDIPDDFDDFE